MAYGAAIENWTAARVAMKEHPSSPLTVLDSTSHAEVLKLNMNHATCTAWRS